MCELRSVAEKLAHPRPTTDRSPLGALDCRIDAGGTAQDALRRADAAMYAAKALGRNRVVSWEDIASKSRPLAAGSPA